MGSHHDLWQSGAAGASFDEEFFRERGFSRAPLLVQWMATEQCSLRCSHCLAGGSAGGSAGGAQLTLSEVARLLDQVADLGVQQLLITGGEPLERPDLPEVVAMLGERHIRWSLNTARMPGGPCRDAMEAYPPAFVAVSLDGPERHHDRHRGEPGAHRQALEAIGYFRRIVPSGQVAAGTTITRQSVGLLEETFGEVVASGATQWDHRNPQDPGPRQCAPGHLRPAARALFG
jgi:MoaA/NifB/PqqE/SkfB family radical SAM enzyme